MGDVSRCVNQSVLLRGWPAAGLFAGDWQMVSLGHQPWWGQKGRGEQGVHIMGHKHILPGASQWEEWTDKGSLSNSSLACGLSLLPGSFCLRFWLGWLATCRESQGLLTAAVWGPVGLLSGFLSRGLLGWSWLALPGRVPAVCKPGSPSLSSVLRDFLSTHSFG